jgi:hypothetical protein
MHAKEECRYPPWAGGLLRGIDSRPETLRMIRLAGQIGKCIISSLCMQKMNEWLGGSVNLRKQ